MSRHMEFSITPVHFEVSVEDDSGELEEVATVYVDPFGDWRVVGAPESGKAFKSLMDCVADVVSLDSRLTLKPAGISLSTFTVGLEVVTSGIP